MATLQERQAKIAAAQTEYFAAQSAAEAEQQVAQQVHAATDAAKVNMLVTAPAAAKALQDKANADYYAAIKAEQDEIAKTTNLWAIAGQKRQAYQEAITQGLDTGAQEQVPPSHPFTGSNQV